MLAGFGIAPIFYETAARRKRILVRLGLAAIGAFILIRLLNVYGDPLPWTTQRTSLFTFLSFMNVSKYPPSLLFCLITLGITLLILVVGEGFNKRISNIVSVYGKVPLFYFLVHFYLLRLITIIMMRVQGFTFETLQPGFNLGRPKEESGVSLAGVYLVWILLVIALYPVCKWFGNYKMNHPEKRWLRYL
jgi:uncharacterized membrane protein